MARILAVGVATLDIINYVDQYPLEDQKFRANSRCITRGGNAANSLVILSQLGHQCYFSGTLALTADTHITENVIENDLDKYKIDISNCARPTTGSIPTSYITLSESTGSRTIIHYRDLPEFCYGDFLKIDLSIFDWIHFEGRTIAETHKMLVHVKKTCATTPVSLEVEKPRENIESLFKLADTLLFSQPYATHKGFDNAELFLQKTHEKLPHKELVCTWGKKNSAAINSHNELISSPTFSPEKLLDTIAAGDTFNAGFIDARLKNSTLAQALESANKLAGKKCGQTGLGNLA